MEGSEANEGKKKNLKSPRISKLVKIERQEKVESSVFGKAFDFSRKTILKLIDEGYQDAEKACGKIKN